jgi:hypothetical protein
MALQSSTQALCGKTVFGVQRCSPFPLQQRHGCLQGKPVHCHRVAFSPQAALLGSQEEDALRCPIQQGPQFIARQLHVIQQDERPLVEQGVADLRIGELDQPVALLEGVHQSLQQVGQGLAMGGKMGNPIRKGGTQGVKSQVT